MSAEIISILVLVAMFALATVVPVNMGLLGFAAAFLVGSLIADAGTRDIVAGFPVGLFLTLTGITYLFAIAQNNGTIDWLVRLALRGVGGRVAAIPWAMFGISAVLTSVGAVSPGAVAIIAPIALGFAARFSISPLMMGLMVIHGAQGGAFSPISIFGGITNKIVTDAALPVDPMFTFLASLAVNTAIAAVLFLLLGGRQLIGTRVSAASEALVEGSGPLAAPPSAAAPPGAPVEASRGLQLYRLLTVFGIFLLAVLALGFGLDIGLTAITIGLSLALLAPHMQKKAVSQVSWPEILLITGVGTYVALLEKMGTIAFVGESVAGIGSPYLASLLLCSIGGVVSAFASTTAVLGSLIPLAVPFLQSGTSVDPIGFIAAMALSSTLVDVSPFSTNGALVLAAAAKFVDRDLFFRRLLAYAAIVTLTAPVAMWLLLIVTR